MAGLPDAAENPPPTRPISLRVSASPRVRLAGAISPGASPLDGRPRAASSPSADLHRAAPFRSAALEPPTPCRSASLEAPAAAPVDRSPTLPTGCTAPLAFSFSSELYSPMADPDGCSFVRRCSGPHCRYPDAGHLLRDPLKPPPLLIAPPPRSSPLPISPARLPSLFRLHRLPLPLISSRSRIHLLSLTGNPISPLPPSNS